MKFVIGVGCGIGHSRADFGGDANGDTNTGFLKELFRCRI